MGKSISSMSFNGTKSFHKHSASTMNLSILNRTTTNPGAVPFTTFGSGEYFYKRLNESNLRKYEPLFNE